MTQPDLGPKTPLDNWPSHLLDFERYVQHALHAVLEDKKESPNHLAEVLTKLVELPGRRRLGERLKCLFGGKTRSQDQNFLQFIDTIKSNNTIFQLLRIAIDNNSLSSNIQNDTDQESLYSILSRYNQIVAQLYYKALISEHEYKNVICLSIILQKIAEFEVARNDISQTRSLKTILNGAKAQAGIATAFREVGAINIFPDINKKEEVNFWDLENGVDFVSIIGDTILLINSKGKQEKRGRFDSAGAAEWPHPVKPAHIEIAKSALRFALQTRQKSLYSNKFQDYKVKIATITVPTTPDRSNHLGRLDSTSFDRVKSELLRNLQIQL